MHNKYPGGCGTQVPPGAGFFQRMNGKWVVRCQNCVGKGNEPDAALKTIYEAYKRDEGEK